IGGECPVDTTFTLSINIDPPAAVTQEDACADNVNLIATPPGNYSYVWFRNGAQFNGSQQVQIGIADNGATYRFDARNRDTGCIIASPNFTATVLGTLSVTVSNAQPCEGVDFQLTATPNRTPDTYAWTLDGTVISGATTQVLQVTNDADGLYRVTITHTSGSYTCTANAEVQINVADVVPGSLLDQYIICPDPANADPASREVLLNPDPRDAYIAYNWFKDGVPLGVTTKTLLATEIGEYSVNVINRNSCPGSDRTDVIEECDPKISGPNAFRPGGLNKEFYLFTFFIADSPFDIFIYNRWGEMVFHSSDINFRWNGGYKNQAGQELPPGTYSYIVKYKSSYRPDKGVQEFRGGVVLLK
ncbi:MAG TPA: gliding motility-associated C-terminal domain-containing protein, partial [Chryseosolibacter sp.]|nr:gliding motility-associated C-terminal domain-containing protein [Chryseosolibacter sp.]